MLQSLLVAAANSVQGLGMLSVKPSEKQHQQFMDAKTNLLNEVNLAVTL